MTLEQAVPGAGAVAVTGSVAITATVMLLNSHCSTTVLAILLFQQNYCCSVNRRVTVHTVTGNIAFLSRPIKSSTNQMKSNQDRQVKQWKPKLQMVDATNLAEEIKDYSIVS